MQVGGGIGASLALGPVGRQAEAALRLGSQGGAICYSYSLSAGVFAGALLALAPAPKRPWLVLVLTAIRTCIGVSIEGSACSTRDHINLGFYGRPVTARQLLLEERCTPPVAAAALYTALDDLLVRMGAPNRLSKQASKPRVCGQLFGSRKMHDMPPVPTVGQPSTARAASNSTQVYSQR